MTVEKNCLNSSQVLFAIIFSICIPKLKIYGFYQLRATTLI